MSEVTSRQIVHKQVKVLAILKGLNHIDKEIIFESFQKFFFIHNTGDRFLADNPKSSLYLQCFRHFFESIDFGILLYFNFPNLPKSSSPNHILEFKYPPIQIIIFFVLNRPIIFYWFCQRFHFLRIFLFLHFLLLLTIASWKRLWISIALKSKL